jgi:hypothetical protein
MDKSIASVLDSLDSLLFDLYGAKGRKVKQKVVTTTKCRYTLKNGSTIKVVLKDNKIVSIKSQDCDAETLKNIIENSKRVLIK